MLAPNDQPKLRPILPFVIGDIVGYVGTPSVAQRRYSLSLRRWYVVHVEPQQEFKVAKTIEDDANFAAYLPLVTKKVRIIRERYRSSKKPMLVGYLFVGFDVTHENWQSVMDIRGVVRVFMYDSRPVPVGEREMQCVRESEAIEAEGKMRKLPLVNVKVGNFVQVLDGPFTGFFGFVIEVDQKRGTVKVELDIFGRPTPVELMGDQVEVVLDRPAGLRPNHRPQYMRPRSSR